MSLELYYRHQSGEVWLGDAFEFLARLPNENVDLIITDPPYESLRRWEGIGTTARMGLGKKGSKADDPDKFFPTIPNSSLPLMLQEFYRVLKSNTHCYVMSDCQTLPHLFCSLGLGLQCPESCIYSDDISYPEFSYWKLLVWHRGALGMGYHFRSCHEYILMLDKGKNRKPKDLAIGDVFSIRPPSPKQYPTQKPVELFELLIDQSSDPGELVVDPFVGAGTAAVAAAKLGRRFLVCDISERACELTARALDSLQLSLPIEVNA